MGNSPSVISCKPRLLCKWQLLECPVRHCFKRRCWKLLSPRKCDFVKMNSVMPSYFLVSSELNRFHMVWMGERKEKKNVFATSSSSNSNGLHFCNTMNCYKLSATYNSCGSLDTSLPANSCSGISFHSKSQVRHIFTMVHSSGKHQFRRLVFFVRKSR